MSPEQFEMHFRDRTQLVPYLSMLEGMMEVHEDDKRADVTGYGELYRVLADCPRQGEAPLSVTIKRWFESDDDAWVHIDLQGIAGDILANCLDNSSGFRPHQADLHDPDYAPEAEDLIFEGDVLIETAATSSSSALTDEELDAINVALVYLDQAYGRIDYPDQTNLTEARKVLEKIVLTAEVHS